MNRTPCALIALCAGSFVFGSACKEEEAEEFGFTCLTLQQADNQEEDPFERTARIKVTLLYDSCLVDYYTKKHTEQRQDGADGPAVFEEWAGRLCTEAVGDTLVACEVDKMTQTLIDAGPSSVFQMEIEYKITDPAKISGRTLLWGPGPLEAYAECEAGQRPYAKLVSQAGVLGYDKDGTPLWQAQSWDTSRAVVQSRTAGCIEVDIAAL